MSKVPTSRLPVTPSKATGAAAAPKSGLRPPSVNPSGTTPATQQISPSAGDASANPFVIGDRVIANDKPGTVAFIGPTKFADGKPIEGGRSIVEPCFFPQVNGSV